MSAPTELPVTVNLSKYHGDSWSQPFTFKDGDQPHDLTNAVVTSAARVPIEETVHMLVVTVPDATNGEVTLHPPGEGLPAGQYVYDVQVVQGGVTLTWVTGKLLIRPDVTP